MRFDDLDWDAASVRVRGKGRKEVRLPLPQDAGDALVEYLTQVRPVANTDRVFLCTNAPLRPFAKSGTVSDIVRLDVRKAGIADAPSTGAHLLRHSAATSMLRSGASLDAIATVLRHQSSDTTAYYEKIDIALLQQVAQPRPEGALLIDNVTRYIELHRALRFKFRVQCYLLHSFATFAEHQGESYVRTETVTAWAAAAPSAAQRRHRLLVVRRFALKMQLEDERYEIPPEHVFGKLEFP